MDLVVGAAPDWGGGCTGMDVWVDVYICMEWVFVCGLCVSVCVSCLYTCIYVWFCASVSCVCGWVGGWEGEWVGGWVGGWVVCEELATAFD